MREDNGFKYELLEGGLPRDRIPERLDAQGRGESGLTLIPNRATRQDVRIVLASLADAVQQLAAADCLLPNFLLADGVWTDGNRIPFIELHLKIR